MGHRELVRLLLDAPSRSAGLLWNLAGRKLTQLTRGNAPASIICFRHSDTPTVLAHHLRTGATGEAGHHSAPAGSHVRCRVAVTLLGSGMPIAIDDRHRRLR